MKSQRALPFWVEAWLALSAVICTLDVVYTMLRPITLRGGRLGVAYAAWNLYSDIDLRYADEKDLVTMATGRIMVIEIIMNLVALLMAFLGSRHTLLTAFTASAFVFWKTLLYMALYVMIPEGQFFLHFNYFHFFFPNFLYGWLFFQHFLRYNSLIVLIISSFFKQMFAFVI